MDIMGIGEDRQIARLLGVSHSTVYRPESAILKAIRVGGSVPPALASRYPRRNRSYGEIRPIPRRYFRPPFSPCLAPGKPKVSPCLASAKTKLSNTGRMAKGLTTATRSYNLQNSLPDDGTFPLQLRLVVWQNTFPMIF